MTLELLSKRCITLADIKEIRSQYVTGRYTLSCDEYHVHSFECIRYENDDVMVIDRLCNELQRTKLGVIKLAEEL